MAMNDGAPDKPQSEDDSEHGRERIELVEHLTPGPQQR